MNSPQKAFFTLIAAILLSFPSVSFAGTFVAFGPQSYQRQSGSPVTVSNSFTVLNPNTSYTLQIYNGGLADGEFEKVSSSVISLNGVQVVGPNEFNQNVGLIEKPVTLAAGNQLSVELRGKPGGGISVQIIGVDNDPPAINASVNPAPNPAGWHRSDPTVSFTCGDSTSGVASCPGPITVSTEAANQAVSGTATDRAGNSATTSVTLNIDKTPPAVAISSPANGATLGNSPVTVTGTITETLSGIASIGCNGNPATLSGSTFTCDVPLTDGPNTITVDAADVAGNAGSSSNSVILRRLSIEITSPAAGSVIDTPTVFVQGILDAPPGTEVGVMVNGSPAAAQGGSFMALVPVSPGTTSLTALATTAAGVTASHTVNVTVSLTTGSPALLHTNPANGIAPLAVNFSLLTIPVPTQVTLDADGNGVIDFSGTELQEQPFTYTQPGTYVATATMTDSQGVQFMSSIIVQVYDAAALDAILQAKWTGMKDALRTGDIAGALSHIVSSSRPRYEEAFQIIAAELPNIDRILTNLSLIRVGDYAAVYEATRVDDGLEMSFEVRFAVDGDGIWRIEAF